MPVRTKRWNDPPSPEDGFRVLICRYRPRGVKKEDEPWDAFFPALAPSKGLHAAAYGKDGEKISFDDYSRAFREEMSPRGYWITGFAERVRRGETVTLLCSSACTDDARCHRSIVKALIMDAAFPKPEAPRAAKVLRRKKP
jgi:uncharacterized protein YeaO (DUF488 family)